MLKRLLVFGAAVCCSYFATAQQRECASHEVHERMLKNNPEYAQRQADIEALTARFVQNPESRQEGGQIIIPCIVHVVYANSNENISDAQVQSQIDRLNKDFSATNSDYNNTPSIFTSVRSGDTDIRFELIETKRYSNSRSTWGTNDAVKYEYPPIEPARILNMWVADIGGGILGYAQFPGGNPSTDGVVMSPQYFGDASVSGGGSFFLSAPFNRGRTATHEVGHWLNLRHIWGDGNCSQDDFVSDTPVAGNPNYGCPSAGTNSCAGGQSDMFMNYMDYVDDACMFMFSAGQDSRMQATFSSGGGREGFLLDPVYTPGGGGGGGGLSCSATETPGYSEGFESSFGAWSNASGDDFNWTRRSGGTPSRNTGPSSAYAGSFYMYVEASSPNYSNKTGIIESPCFDLAGQSSATFSFRYHMYGASNMGSLQLQATTDGSTWGTIWSKSGNQGNSWAAANVDLGNYLGDDVKLRFVGTTGNTWQGDMAVDAISLSGSGGGGGGGTTTVNLSITLDNYPEETSWQIRSGSTVIASGGTYGQQPDGSTVTQNIELNDGCYDFVISDTYGDGICCSYGNGSYSLTAGGSTLASGGSFGSSETTNFCVGAGARSANSTVTREGQAPAGFSIFPNPANNKVTIYSGKMKAPNYMIINTAGRIYQQGVITGNQSEVNVSGLESGFYIVKVTDGENTVVHKLVKQ
ncbi:T9SS type A sorting domain-containing protein [Fulvivirga sp. RKSG066]|uniref:T9SS type A sorting domain-containing protein n=1 Tax=Fulvivirga aurantia TaxID=2529383 RepID=UPI0012BCB5E6|nr:T9SS type A sorting domain-containing protein [Fulvivirga aurantia]MTI21522.1 T9SS type A sorting domain-containing protein [Fulvivirga aurantia]